MTHFKKVCSCGILLTQCRCIGPKHEMIVSPCTHKKDIESRVEPYNWEDEEDE